MPLQPTASSVHINRPLTNLSIAYLQNQDQFIADKVIPNVPVNFQSDTYFLFDRAYFNSDDAKLRAPGTESAGGGYELDTATYSCKKYSFHKDIPDEVRANTDSPLNADRNAAQYITQKMLLKKEALFASTYMATSLWTNEVSGANTQTTDEAVYWDDHTSSDPIREVRKGIITVQESTGFKPNVLVLTEDVRNALLDHPDILDRIKYTSSNSNPTLVNDAVLAAVFGVRRVVTGGAIKNTAKEGQTATHEFIMKKKALLLHVPDNPGIETPSAGYNFSWTGFDSRMNNMGMLVKTMRMEHLDSDRIEATMFFDMKLVSADLGYFFNNIIEGALN